jgi:dCMP deaminase
MYNPERISVDSYFIEMAQLVSKRATCKRRKVGCVLVNSRNHVIATGYNGVAAGLPHCIEKQCKGACFPSGEGLEFCEAIHAEQNALLQCKDVYEIAKCYVTHSPCIHCVKMLLNTSCQEIVFKENYTHTDSKNLWENSGRIWRYI